MRFRSGAAVVLYHSLATAQATERDVGKAMPKPKILTASGVGDDHVCGNVQCLSLAPSQDSKVTAGAVM